MNRKRLSLLLCLVMLLSILCGCGTSDSSSNGPDTSTSTESSADDPYASLEPLTLSLVNNANTGTAYDLWCVEFKTLIEEKSGGKVTVDYYPSGQMGGDRELCEGVQAGTYDIYCSSPMSVLSFMPGLAMFCLPYLFTEYDTETIDKALNDSAATPLIEAEYEEAGFKLIGGEQQGSTYRETTANRKIETLEDFAGLKIRVPESTYLLAFWNAIGASPVGMNFGELYLALQQGVVDAQENPYDTAALAGFQEVQKYLINTHHVLVVNHMLMNKERFESLPAEYQELIQDCATEARYTSTEEMVESYEGYHQMMIDGGMTEINLSDDTMNEIKSAVQVVYDQYEEELGDELLNAVLTALEENK